MKNDKEIEEIIAVEKDVFEIIIMQMMGDNEKKNESLKDLKSLSDKKDEVFELQKIEIDEAETFTKMIMDDERKKEKCREKHQNKLQNFTRRLARRKVFLTLLLSKLR